MTFGQALAERAVNESELLSYPNVVGVGVGMKTVRGEQTGDYAVVTLVSKKLPEAALRLDEFVPNYVGNVPVDVMQVGNIWALSARVRPAPGGVSIGHYKITAGTLGSRVYDGQLGRRVILSNNHVLANSNDAAIGDPIYQPGPYDGGSSSDVIGHLLRFVPIKFGEEEPDPDPPPECEYATVIAKTANWVADKLGRESRLQVAPRGRYRPAELAKNYVDAAIALVVSDDDLSDEILTIGTVEDTVEDPTLGMGIRKHGRTTQYTTGSVLVVNTTVDVGYGPGLTARFANQCVSGPMSAGGDSGSVMVKEKENRAVGLLFAGSDQVTIFNPISSVLAQLNIHF
jgi:hypothetical protein